MPLHTRIAPTLAVSSIALVLLVTLSACGGSSGGSSAAAPQPSQSAAAGRGPAFGGGGQPVGFPGTNGLLAAIDGKTLQVQSQQSGQVAVTYTATTRFTRTVAAKAADVVVGSCVAVRSSTAQGSSSSAVTAASISIAAPVGGSCLRRGTGFGAGRAGGPGGARPSGAPSRSPRNAAAGFRPTVGAVTAVHGSSLTVAAASFGVRPPSGTSTAAPDPTPSTVAVTVTTGAGTTYTKTVRAASSDLAVGQCVQAAGKADDTGAVTATSISTQAAVDGQCTGGFGAGRRTTSGSS